MSERIGYAVYSEIEAGYLATASPSNYLWDPAAAIIYETAAKAWTSAKRRGAGYAIAVAINRNENGNFEHEQIPPPMKAPPGSWIVKIEGHGLPTGPLYITSLSKDGKPRASSEIHEPEDSTMSKQPKWHQE
ncbi:hypothetical protein [Aeromonas veronii]|uniref:hypothetical protein n=1 Tax=Aeromonas veronii TaxID=654 RepID=UPI0011169569|nr:hypothetical protein [Aeromonas veronii]